MNILNKFTLKSLSKNKKRTIVTIIGISLSTALICAVAGMFMSLRKTLINTAKVQSGNYHIMFQDVQKNELQYIENNTNVQDYFYSKPLGYSYLDGIKNEYKPYLYVLGCDEEALNNSGFKLMEGRFPQNDSEITVSKHITSNGGVKLEVGDVLKLNIGDRQSIDGVNLNQYNPFMKIEEENRVDEKLTNTVYKEFTIVGIMERPNNTMEEYSAPGYTVVTYLSDEQISNMDGLTNISVLLKNPSSRADKEDFIKSIQKLSEEDESVINVQENSELLMYEGNLSTKTMRTLYLIVAIIIGIIVVSSVFVIRNSFSISVSERNKEYGMMASVGATSKQIKKSVLFEAFLLGIIGIPLGIVIGIIAVVILVWLLNTLLTDDLLYGFKFLYGIPVSVVLTTILMSSITIFLSSYAFAVKASKITPIDAIKNSEQLKINPKKLKTAKLTKKLFGMGGVIASKNLKRSKKKYRTTVVSLVVSISIFIALSSFTEYGMKMARRVENEYKYNVQFYANDNGSDLFDKEHNEEKLELFNQIINNFNLQEYCYMYTDTVYLSVAEYATPEFREYMKKMGLAIDYTYPSVKKINRDEFKRYIKELGIKENSKDVIILRDDIPELTDIKGNEYNIKDGQTITVKKNDVEKNIRITKRADVGPMGLEYTAYNHGYILMSEDNELFEDGDSFVLDSSLYINSDDPSKLETELNEFISNDSKYDGATVFNISADAENNQRIIIVVSIFLYGFIAVITLIGVTNIFNTITTNMILRSKEFAMLKSVGMTKKEFNRMIRLESIMYGLKSLVIGIPLGVILSFIISKVLSMEINLRFMIPIKAIVIAFVFVFIIVWLTMRYSLNKINKQNIVETIRNDNI